MSLLRKEYSVLPGFGLSLGFTLAYLGLIVLVPLSAAFLKTAGMSWDEFIAAVASPRVMAAYRLSFFASLAAATVNAFFGLIVALVACQQGLRTDNGAVGVGKATTNTVVISMVLIYISNFLLAQLLFR
jgi:sulfate transport system permease protein